VILADEPTGALDSQGGKEVMTILEKLHAQGHTIMCGDHDKDIAAFATASFALPTGESPPRAARRRRRLFKRRRRRI